jgi:hypothetical protein
LICRPLHTGNQSKIGFRQRHKNSSDINSVNVVVTSIFPRTTDISQLFRRIWQIVSQFSS